MTETWFKAED